MQILRPQEQALKLFRSLKDLGIEPWASESASTGTCYINIRLKNKKNFRVRISGHPPVRPIQHDVIEQLEWSEVPSYEEGLKEVTSRIDFFKNLLASS